MKDWTEGGLKREDDYWLKRIQVLDKREFSGQGNGLGAALGVKLLDDIVDVVLGSTEADN